jgi:hypothetical protein
MSKILDIRKCQVNVTSGVLRELILSRGWKLEPNAVGTVWHAIYKMTYDFVMHLETTLPKRMEKLNKDNLSRKWKKTFIQVSQKVEWTEDTTVLLSSTIYFGANGANGDAQHLCGIGVKIKGTNKKNFVDAQVAIDRFLSKELEKTLK